MVVKAVVSNNCVIGENAVIGSDEPNVPWVKNAMCSNGITLIGDRVSIGKNVRVGREMRIEKDIQGGDSYE